MRTHDEMIEKWMQDPEFRAEYERLEREEMPMLDAILQVRKRYSLKELLKNTNHEAIQELNAEMQWISGHGNREL